MVAENAILQFSPIEAEIEKVARDTAALEIFIGQWTVDELPACPTGIMLLKRFGDAHPEEFEIAKAGGFMPLASPFFNENGLWQEYVAHFGNCYDCDESGAAPIAYVGRRRLRLVEKEKKPNGIQAKTAANGAQDRKRKEFGIPDLFSDSLQRKRARKAVA